MLLVDIIYSVQFSRALRAESKRAHQIEDHYGPAFQPKQSAACLRCYFCTDRNISFVDFKQMHIFSPGRHLVCADRLRLLCRTVSLCKVLMGMD